MSLNDLYWMNFEKEARFWPLGPKAPGVHPGARLTPPRL